jgi:hypothetical protein
MATTKRMKGRKAKTPPTTRRRNYRAEYARRVQLGVSKGFSRSQARGHARAGERPKAPGPVIINPRSKEEHAIKAMRAGVPLRTAARTFGLSGATPASVREGERRRGSGGTPMGL